MTGAATFRAALAVLANALLAPLHAHGTIYRCSEGNRVTYADRPCNGAAIVVDSTAGLAHAKTPAYAAGSARDIPLAAVRVDIASAAADRGILGMSPLHVFATLGRPHRMSMKLDRGLVIERWTYRGAQRRTEVLFRLGRVTDVVSE
jgi:hypothetical protein